MSRADKKKEKEERKERIRERYVGVDPSLLETIPPEDTEADIPIIQKKNLRVAAYVRVSTDDENQTSSYELQINHYKDFIAQHDGWELVGIYADEGISGTSIEHRVQFNKLIRDCEGGNIDLIVTKSISRFARNTVDSLVTQRKLANMKHPVGVFFETENLNSLEKGNDIIMTVLSATAQEESHVKSEIMVQSLKNRFDRGIFLTPELLGYDRDEDGNLVINDDEADTVRLIYYLFLSGFSMPDIAEMLTILGRETKPGNTTWNPGSIRGILENERYCGDVISWKRYTYDYLGHKKKRNHGARPRVRQTDHHEAIVSHEEWEAAQKMISNHKYGNRGQALPVLEVVNGGALRGFVPVNRSWTNFSDEDYVNASRSAYEDDLPEDRSEAPVSPAGSVSSAGSGNPISHADDFADSPFDLSGYEIVSSRLFNTCQPTLTISGDYLRFNTVCMKEFQDVENVELLLNTVEKCLAVRPCDKNNVNSIRWGKLKDNGRWVVLPKTCRGLAEPLYSIMGWSGDYGYRLTGEFFEDNGEKVMFFKMDDPEILQRVDVEEDVVNSEDVEGRGNNENAENVSQDEDAAHGYENMAKELKPARKKTVVIHEPDIGDGYGDAGGELHFLQWIDIGGNWEILRPADSVEGIQEFNAEDVSRFTDKAQKLIDKMDNRSERHERGNGQPTDSGSVSESGTVYDAGSEEDI